MANDNETVEQVLERMTRGMGRDCSVECQLLESDVVEYADRILTAHEREMNALAAQKTAEAHEAFVKNAELAEAIEAKDAEIASLKDKNTEAFKAVLNRDKEIAKLRSLVEGLFSASAMECADCRYDCGPNRENCIIHEAANYIKKVEIEND